MTDREKTIRGLECCLPPHDPDCDLCPYDSIDLRCRSKLHEDVMALLKAQEPIEARLHLCESCTKEYPECDATADGIEFGYGVGNDNVIGCTVYVNRWKAQEPRVMTLSDVCNLKENTLVWLEDVDKKDVICALFIKKDFGDTKCVGFSVPYKWYFKRITADYIDYGIRWRCWDKEPTDEQRKATPWND